MEPNKSLLKILIIDDEKELLDSLSETIRSFNIDVTTCDDGDNALPLIETLNAFDYIICDIHMPYINGIDFVTKLRAKNDLTPVIFMTAYHSERIIQSINELESCQLIEKPFFEDLFEKLRSIQKAA